MESRAQERETLISKGRGQDALDHAIAAADLYMQAARQAGSPSDKTRLKQKCMELISQGEKLKQALQKRLRLPRMTREIPTSERNILLRGSRLHGNLFPPWVADPGPDEFTGEMFFDNAVFSLSDIQDDVFAGWKRPLEIARIPANLDEAATKRLLMETSGDFDLVQDITTDCSVVASLCASIHYIKPGPMSMLPTLMFPADAKTGQPSISVNGKYIFRMYFNGCFRKVVVDDRLPSSSNDRTLHVVDRQNPHLIWPALMEKAYLKVRGGYDFPGSNSGTDLWVLTGWIPQQIFLQSEDVDLNQTWRRIKKACEYGDVVVTLGTGRLSADEEEALGLAGEHDYAVLEIAGDSNTRKLLVKNPWCNGLVWKGLGSYGGAQGSQNHDTQPTDLKPGTFWINFDDVAQNFESLYLNWNPGLFAERQDHHFMWTEPGPNMVHAFAHHPQYSMTAQTDDNTWILLNRHFQDGELNIARSRSTTLAATSNKLGFMSIYIFENDGKRVQLSDKSIYRGPFVDSPQTLAPFEAKKGVKYTIVVACQDLPLPRYPFTLAFFSQKPLVIEPAAHSLQYYTESQSSWTRRTAGGNASSPTYLRNPQFSISVPRPGPISILLATARDDIPVHIDLVWADGQRVTAVTVRDLVATSGDYRRGSAQVRVPHVDTGSYTVVCSTFEAGQLADFTLRVGSDIPCAVTPVLADAAGLLRTRIDDDLTFGPGEEKKRGRIHVPRLTRATIIVTAPSNSSTSSVNKGGGGASHHQQQTSSSLSPLAHHRNHSYHHHRTPLMLRLTLEHGRGPNKTILARTSDEGEFREVGLGGLRTPEVDLDPDLTNRDRGGLWIVAEQQVAGVGRRYSNTDDGDSSAAADRYESGALSISNLALETETLQVEVLSDGHVEVGGWEVVDE